VLADSIYADWLLPVWSDRLAEGTDGRAQRDCVERGVPRVGCRAGDDPQGLGEGTDRQSHPLPGAVPWPWDGAALQPASVLWSSYGAVRIEGSDRAGGRGQRLPVRAESDALDRSSWFSEKV